LMQRHECESVRTTVGVGHMKGARKCQG
jgi:hypothetical protein